jgi:hypothetical protein
VLEGEPDVCQRNCLKSGTRGLLSLADCRVRVAGSGYQPLTESAKSIFGDRRD